MVKDNSCGIAPLQEKMLDILKVLLSICEKEQLLVYAAGGTCIGALRHQGFIPWDDDVDVLMPRPDYEKLWKLYGGKTIFGHYLLCRTTEEKNYHHRVIQLVDLNTTFINKRSVNEDIEHGIYIDIIPLDARAKTPLGRLQQFKDAILFSVYNIQCKPEFNGGRLMRAATGILLKLVPSKKMRFRIWQKAERRMTRYDWQNADEAIELTTSLRVLRHPYPIAWFRSARQVPYEDTTVPIPVEAEKYLTQVFGDYMSLPPREDQCVKHNTVFIDLENPYTMYRGKYYCCGRGEADQRG